ncbi:hypothetical protein C8Q72DRAFT_500910 [Fomitopsis betulina]|nr:hypothetical protein C8Q72DRAFT_500910 [Fomitopsis betulina]
MLQPSSNGMRRWRAKHSIIGSLLLASPVHRCHPEPLVLASSAGSIDKIPVSCALKFWRLGRARPKWGLYHGFLAQGCLTAPRAYK